MWRPLPKVKLPPSHVFILFLDRLILLRRLFGNPLTTKSWTSYAVGPPSPPLDLVGILTAIVPYNPPTPVGLVSYGVTHGAPERLIMSKSETREDRSEAEGRNPGAASVVI